jgi:hypothetical protein
MTDPRLLSVVEELIRSLELARDELYARNSVGARVINDQIEGVRAEIAARIEREPLPTLRQRTLRLFGFARER